MPQFVCPCGQRFAGDASPGDTVTCSRCGRSARIPETISVPQLAQLPSDLLDDLAAVQQASVDVEPAQLPSLPARPQRRKRSTPPAAGEAASILIDWRRFLPMVGGFVLLLVIVGTLIVVAPSWWEPSSASASKSTSGTTGSAARHQPVEPSWFDANFNDKIYTLSSDAVDHPVSPRIKAGFRREPGAITIEQGLELRFDVEKLFPTEGAIAFTLAGSAPQGASLDERSGVFQWTPPLDFPPGVQEFTVQRTFADQRRDRSLRFKVQVLPSQGTLPPFGQLAPAEPIQTETSRQPFKFRGSTIHPLADYELTALVLSSKFYTTGEEAYVSPLDLALGWGCMSDETLLRRIDISQAKRRIIFYTTTMLDTPADEMNLTSANVHIIPSTSETANLLASVRRGDLVRLTGALVEVKRGNWKWRSSLTRKDKGDGACEVMWVDHAEILAR